MIPELIHFIWFPPSPNESEPPEDVRRNILEWQRLHSGFQIKIWGYDDLESLQVLKDIDIWNHLSSCRFEAMKSDIVRLAIAYEHGGFYNDLKNLPMLSFLGELVTLDEIVLVEVPPYIPNFKDLISNSFFAGPPKHEFFLECLKRIQHKISRRLGHDISATTGGDVLRAVAAARLRAGLMDYRIIHSVGAWGFRLTNTSGLMERTSASYNGAELSRHWSVRQGQESLYLDADELWLPHST